MVGMPLRKKIKVPLALCFVGVLLLFLWSGSLLSSGGRAVAPEVKENLSAVNTTEAVFLLILCDASRYSWGIDDIFIISEKWYVQQIGILIKSAVALTRVQLRFVVVTDYKDLYDQIAELTDNWPLQYQRKISFNYLPVWYPSDRKDMINMFKFCATERLFVPSMLPDEDAIIYIDADMIFMRPPEDLWAEFNNFNSKQVAAMAPCFRHYGTKSMVPFYGETGLNAGVMLMNLTRMKTFPEGGWLEANMAVYDKYKEQIELADQDILNIIFNKYPDLMYELGCEWNYRMFQCRTQKNSCPVTSTEGASLVHGNGYAFISDRERKSQVLFNSWKNYQLGTPLEGLYDTIKKSLQRVTDKKLQTNCLLEEIDVVLSQQIINHIERSRHL